MIYAVLCLIDAVSCMIYPVCMLCSQYLRFLSYLISLTGSVIDL
jgi:hypothetical protein